ncbi:unnamed protein product [Clonostachys rhizophaga]|uniref:Uncharacterized protein n=1 Tax=Clonostachys rhizophaga TaxID=160324 RepID=A0A9N9YK16_9HYPO|nr:unnamed protein product [Clonostachys rhizophaga]CAH0020077.1 unnamed protein product [Clonostachys rhizophaga]
MTLTSSPRSGPPSPTFYPPEICSGAPTYSSKEPCAVKESEADVVYLGTFPRRPDHESDKNSTPDSNTADGGIHNPKNRRSGPDRRTKSSQVTGKGPGCKTVPASIRNQNIRIGYARDSKRQVNGCFDEQRRFRRLVEVDFGGADPFIVWKPIPHEQVLYRRPYQNKSSRQVRDAVQQRLTEASISSASQGEI